MERNWFLSPDRQLTEEEKSLVWRKTETHIESTAQQRIRLAVKQNWTRNEMKITNILLEGDAGSGKTQLAKALSADFGLPYTKVTCFADMDKSDILGSILPVLTEDGGDSQGVEYQYYPSEIIRAYEQGWLLEIQEPTVIRDAAVLMALNSALEPDGSINLPTRIVHRHPDFIAVITTNRGYNGCRPLNEALRDRVQHVEKMDLPDLEVMIDRAASKTECRDKGLLKTLGEVIILLDKTARANAMKGVAGMRSYFFWVDAVLQGGKPIETLYHKVIYKITTDPDEIVILEQALSEKNMLHLLEEVSEHSISTDRDELEICTEGNSKAFFSNASADNLSSAILKKTEDSQGGQENEEGTTAASHPIDIDENGNPRYHELQQNPGEKPEEEKRRFRRHLNQQARELVKNSIHQKINLIVHRPEVTLDHYREYDKTASHLMPVIRELVQKTKPFLEYEVSVEFSKNRVYGTRFHAEKLSSSDFRCFSRKSSPEEEPSLAVCLRIDQSASMNAFGRLDAAKQAAVAVYEFCRHCDIPLLVYGDTADRSPMEKMSLYSYIDWEEENENDKYSLMAIQSYSNNRDGMALRILAEKLMKVPGNNKLLISISDGQPKAMPDYTGTKAVEEMKSLIGEYRRKGILFLAAAIGQDKETICHIYGQEYFIDITDLKQLPARLIQIISNYL